MKEYNDWSTHLIEAENKIKSIEQKLLNHKRDGLSEDVAAAVLALYATLHWATDNPNK